MLVEALIAFVLIFVSTFAIYTVGKRPAPKTTISENEPASYACGGTNPFFLIVYLGIILAAGLVLLEGGKE